jgi:hypothetical protein
LAAGFSRLAQLAHEEKITDVGWMQYQSVADHQLSDLDEAFFEFAHFLADLMSVDGALILTKRWEIVGFGAELLSEAPRLTWVRRAMDLEAEIWAKEALDDVGSRIAEAGAILCCRGTADCAGSARLCFTATAIALSPAV